MPTSAARWKTADKIKRLSESSRRRKQMSKKIKESLKIVSQEKIAADIYSMWLQADHMADISRPGQFLSLYTRDGSKLLP